MAQNRSTKTIFVGYPYGAYPKVKYRQALRALERDFAVTFVFADDKITNMHLLEKVITLMKGADLCLFDLTDWNANVTLELGVAYEAGLDWLSCYNPKKTGKSDVIADLRGFDRFEYRTLSELTGKLANALEGRVDKRTLPVSAERAGTALRNRIKLILTNGKGFRADQLAAALNANIDQIQVTLEPMIKNRQVRYKGKARGRKYFLR